MARSTLHQWFSGHDNSRHQARIDQPRSRKLRLEPLEDRRLLALVTVDTLNDTVDVGDGVTSLREAIFATNLVDGPDTIQFAASLTSGGPATITLMQGELPITDSLTINGPGANLLTIDASGSDSTPGVRDGHGSRILNIDSGNSIADKVVSIFGLTLTGGDVGNSGNGGAVRSLEQLTITASSISGNAAAGVVTTNYTLAGGGIYSTGNLTIAASTISNNFAQDRGGGILMRRGDLQITDSTISSNAANFGGGIVKADSPGNATIVRSTISDNETRSNHFGGGGILQWGGTVTLIGSTIARNSAYRGGGIETTAGNLVLTESTVSGNTAFSPFAGSGGILVSSGALSLPASVATITRSTITSNSGGGILSQGNTIASHTIVAGNIDGDIIGNATLSFSLLGVDTGATITDNGGNLIGTAAAPIDPLLAPLADNGGPTMTHELLPASPAINRGNLNAVAGMNSVPEFDQRGMPFGRVFSGRIDIGAFEYQAASDLNLVVDTLADESDGNYTLGDLSLREAILLSNTYLGVDTIRFEPELVTDGPATILLTMGELVIRDDTTIEGLGAELLTIDASGNDPTPNENNGDGSTVFRLSDGYITTPLIDVSISGLTLTGGDSSGNGGAIHATENLTLVDSIVTGNSATNPAESAGNGGGIYIKTFFANYVVFPPVFNATLSVINSTITGNSASRDGGGIYFSSRRSFTLTNSTVAGNSAGRSGGGIWGGVRMTGSTISDNIAGQDGGGIHGGGTADDSTISGNSAGASGGGVWGAGTFLSTTLSGNSAAVGGGLFATATTTFEHSTIGFNAAAIVGKGLFINSGTMSIDHSIVAQNSGPNGDITGLLGTSINAHYSLIGNNQGSGLAMAPVGAPDANGNLIGGAAIIQRINPLLGPLTDNGGPTMTHALLPGSPAINTGDPAAVPDMDGIPLHDKRGAPWSRVHGGRIDIGALESQPNPLTGDYNFDGIVSAADYTVWRDTLSSTTDLRANGDDSNNVIDNADYGVWAAHFGNSLAARASGEERGASILVAGKESSSAIPSGMDTPVRASRLHPLHGGQECPPHDSARMLALLDLLDSLPHDDNRMFHTTNRPSALNEESERAAAFAELSPCPLAAVLVRIL